MSKRVFYSPIENKSVSVKVNVSHNQKIFIYGLNVTDIKLFPIERILVQVYSPTKNNVKIFPYRRRSNSLIIYRVSKLEIIFRNILETERGHSATFVPWLGQLKDIYLNYV